MTDRKSKALNKRHETVEHLFVFLHLKCKNAENSLWCNFRNIVGGSCEWKEFG